ncbi:Lrp/AsnC family transcriptional regulator [Amycolatopsis acidicola]|uniref:Lrp/AsnC family transcriptional regulator n=2 Tax=Amycolatopsis acidicola TaxID=2596893 RepID=A0A5N0UZ95_9PSEU|nr:Lrp/AsnC family transcriptional regulator [Amycolatopsis acidicola]
MHVNPRVSFETLGPALGLSPATVSRRWQRLSASGLAWVSSVPGPQAALVGAVLEIAAVPGRTDTVARALSGIPHVVSVYLTSGDHDVAALVLATDMRELTTLLFGIPAAIDGLAKVRTHIGIVWYSDVHWRLGALSAGEERTVRDGEPPGKPALNRGQAYTESDRALFLALQPDGRARYRDLGERLGVPEHVVRRRMAALVRRGMLAFRTDFARWEGGWPAQVILWLSASGDGLHEAGREIGGWREARICLSVVGMANLFVVVQLHRLAELGELLARIRSLPEVTVVDQRVVLRPVKSWGRLLDGDGHAAGLVPADLWTPVTPENLGTGG